MPTAPAVYPRGEELANSVSHGIGIALAIVGLVLLVVYASLRGTAWHIAGVSVYGAMMVALYSASTLYHSVRSPRARHVLRIIDHSSIYLLIAGTYTPFTLVSLRGGWGWTLFGLVWGFALVGIVVKAFFVGRLDVVSTIAYLVMGWLVIIAIRPMMAHVPAGGLFWLVMGGILYSGGTIFYLWRRLPFHHAVWHLFVLGGSVCHFFAVFWYVVP